MHSLMKFSIRFCSIVIFSLGLNVALPAQELNAEVQVINPKVQTSNPRIFETLENAITNFLNNRKWTDLTFAPEERIRCQFLINITKKSSNSFEANLQITYSRPIFNSGYASPVLVHKDDDFSFEYVEYERLEFNPNTFSSNLTSVLAYYAYIILGYDQDTYGLKSGSEYFQTAQRIVGNAQNQGFTGWGSFDGNRNRYWLVDNLNSPAFDNFRSCLYLYHRQGLDLMHDPAKIETAKKNIKNALMSLEKVNNQRRNSMALAMWFDAKNFEIRQIFNGGAPIPIAELKSLLAELDPVNAGDYQKMQAS